MVQVCDLNIHVFRKEMSDSISRSFQEPWCLQVAIVSFP